MDSTPCNHAAPRPTAPEESGRGPVAIEHVLVVDDEPAQQMLSQLQLKKLGCQATVASSGEEAMSLFVSAKKENKPSPFDLVLMDMVMPGLDGLSASRAILDLYPGQNIVIASGYAPGAHAETADRLGLFWLLKPYTITDLAQTVRAAGGKRSSTSPTPPAN